MTGNVTKWTVEIHLGEREGRTHAQARLITGVEPPLDATGDAQLSEKDPVDVPEIGYELAAARALRALAELLMKTAEDDVEAVTGDEGEHRSSDNDPRAW
jgi:hypothetical protein